MVHIVRTRKAGEFRRSRHERGAIAAVVFRLESGGYARDAPKHRGVQQLR